MNYDFKRYLWGDITSRIITINMVVWIVVSIGMLTLGAQGRTLWIGLFGVPESISTLPLRPWTVLTYMFTHVDFLHMLVNMMWLMIFGRMVEYYLGARRLAWLYVASGMAGAVAFIVCNAIAPGMHHIMYGASCAVIGVIGYVTVSSPHWRIGMLFLGPVKLLWVAMAAIVLFVVLEPSLYVSIAHAAGMTAGIGYGLWRRYPNAMPGLMRKLRLRSVHPDMGNMSDEDMLDELLDKVNRSGYSSLSPAQRQRLFELSQRFKKN